MSKKYSLFVCGTPSQRGGFKHKVLEGERLPSTPSKYLDKYTPESMKEGSTYIVQQLKIEDKIYSLLIEYKEIVPTGKKSSQGSYIAVGILTQEPINVNDSIVFYQMIAEVHAHLFAYRDRYNAFVPSFDLDRYIYRPKKLSLDIAYLIDTFCRASSNQKALFAPMGKVVYNEVEYANSMITNKGFHYLADSSDKVKKIAKLEEKLANIENKNKNILISIDKLKQSYKAKKNEHSELKKRYEAQKKQINSLQSKNIKLIKEKEEEKKVEPLPLYSNIENPKIQLPFDAKYLLWGLIFIAVLNMLF